MRKNTTSISQPGGRTQALSTVSAGIRLVSLSCSLRIVLIAVIRHKKVTDWRESERILITSWTSPVYFLDSRFKIYNKLQSDTVNSTLGKNFPRLISTVFCKSRLFARGLDCLSREHERPRASLWLLAQNFLQLLNVALVAVFVLSQWFGEKIPHWMS